MIERQTIVTWYTPEEKMPNEGDITVVTISGKRGGVTYDHSFALAEWFNDGDGWNLTDIDMDEFTVHAWADLTPYGGKS